MQTLLITFGSFPVVVSPESESPNCCTRRVCLVTTMLELLRSEKASVKVFFKWDIVDLRAGEDGI